MITRLLLICFCCLATVAPLCAQSSAEEDLPTLPATLISEGDTPTTILSDLEAQGVLPLGSDLIFSQTTLSYRGDTARFNSFGFDNTAAQFVMGARLSFTPTLDADDSLQYCAIAGRVLRQERQHTVDEETIATIRLAAYLTVGIDHEGHVFTFEIAANGTSDLTRSEVSIDLEQPVTLVAIVRDERLTVYIDGERALTDIAVTAEAGSFALLYAGAHDASTCQAENFFAIAIPDVPLGVCQVTAARLINQREGAGTNFARVDQLSPETVAQAIAQTIGTDGYPWWQLDDGSWVRDDVVTVQGYCGGLPDEQDPTAP